MIRFYRSAVVFAIAVGCGLPPNWAADPAIDSASNAETGPAVIAAVPDDQAAKDSPPSEPAFPPGTPADPLSALVAADPATAKAEAEFQDEIAKAEAVYKAARRAAAEKRLQFVKRRVEYQTKQGDFDKATVAKATQVQLETSGTDIIRPRPTDCVKFGGHTYALIAEPATWHVAKKRCEEMGGHLAVLNDAAEDTAVCRLVGGGYAWVGASDEEVEGQWRWILKSKYFPDANINGDSGQSHFLARWQNGWHDSLAGDRFHFVCEWD